MINLLIGLLVLGALGLLGLLAVRRWRESALRELLVERILDEDKDDDPAGLWRSAADLLQLARMQDLVERSPLIRRLTVALRQGDLSLTLYRVMGLMSLVGLLGAGLGLALAPHPAFALLGLLLPPMIGWQIVLGRAERRIHQRERQLPGFCTQMLSSLRTGSTPLSSLQGAARVSPEPLGRSLRELQNSLQLGVSPNLAWKDWAHHCGGDHAHILATGIRLKWEAGGQMSSMLEHILASMIARERMVLRVGTLTAQAKMGSIVLSLLPILFMAYSYSVNPRIFAFMLGDPIGRTALWTGGGLVMLGFFWLRRLSKLDF